MTEAEREEQIKRIIRKLKTLGLVSTGDNQGNSPAQKGICQKDGLIYQLIQNQKY